MLQFDLTTVSETVFTTAIIFCYITNDSELNMIHSDRQLEGVNARTNI
jgi:hypothetical protein